MAVSGSYKVPAPLKDEDKWFKFFTKSQLLSIGVAVLIGFQILVFFGKHGLVPVGLAICLLIVIGVGVCVMVRIPPDKYLIGGGEYIAVILFRIIRKKLPKNKVLYIKNYNDEL